MRERERERERERRAQHFSGAENNGGKKLKRGSKKDSHSLVRMNIQGFSNVQCSPVHSTDTNIVGPDSHWTDHFLLFLSSLHFLPRARILLERHRQHSAIDPAERDLRPNNHFEISESETSIRFGKALILSGKNRSLDRKHFHRDKNKGVVIVVVYENETSGEPSSKFQFDSQNFAHLNGRN